LGSFDRIVMLWETDRASGTTHEPASVPDFLDYKARARTIDALAALMATEVNLTRPTADPERLLTLRASHEMLPMVGVATGAGRGDGCGPRLSGAGRQAGCVNHRVNQSIARAPVVRKSGGCRRTDAHARRTALRDRRRRTRHDRLWRPADSFDRRLLAIVRRPWTSGPRRRVDAAAAQSGNASSDNAPHLCVGP